MRANASPAEIWGKPKYLRLSEIVEYVSIRSTWVKLVQANPSSWRSFLKLSMRDEFSLGNIQAAGRRYTGKVGSGVAALEWIPREAWRRSSFLVETHAHDETMANALFDEENAATYEDVMALRRDVERIWRPLRPWERYKPPHELMTDEDRETQRMAELLEFQLNKQDAGLGD
jgi:hypothetical protein